LTTMGSLNCSTKAEFIRCCLNYTPPGPLIIPIILPGSPVTSWDTAKISCPPRTARRVCGYRQVCVLLTAKMQTGVRLWCFHAYRPNAWCRWLHRRVLGCEYKQICEYMLQTGGCGCSAQCHRCMHIECIPLPKP